MCDLVTCAEGRIETASSTLILHFAFSFPFFFCPVSFSRYSLGFTKVEIVVAKVLGTQNYFEEVKVS